jgi:hypothetical protein
MNVIPETHGAHSSRYLRLFIFRMFKHQFKACSSTDNGKKKNEQKDKQRFTKYYTEN